MLTLIAACVCVCELCAGAEHRSHTERALIELCADLTQNFDTQRL